MTDRTGGRELLFLMTQQQAAVIACLVEAAEAGDGAAACRLGDLYREGKGGLRCSPRQAFHWYARSAMAGNVDGQNNVGACYEHGIGCAQSYPNAVSWYRRSVAQGNATASMNLGYCYLRGHGVPRDQVEALRLFREAVEGGEERAEQEVEKLEGDRDVTTPSVDASDPRPVSAEACPRGHAVNPSLEARIRPSLPHDGPREQLRHSHVAAATTDRQDPDAANTELRIDRDPRALNNHAAREQPQASPDRSRSRVRFVEETQSGKHFGLVGVGGAAQHRIPAVSDSHSNDDRSTGDAGAGGSREDGLPAERHRCPAAGGVPTGRQGFGARRSASAGVVSADRLEAGTAESEATWKYLRRVRGDKLQHAGSANSLGVRGQTLRHPRPPMLVHSSELREINHAKDDAATVPT